MGEIEERATEREVNELREDIEVIVIYSCNIRKITSGYCV